MVGRKIQISNLIKQKVRNRCEGPVLATPGPWEMTQITLEEFAGRRLREVTRAGGSTVLGTKANTS